MLRLAQILSAGVFIMPSSMAPHGASWNPTRREFARGGAALDNSLSINSGVRLVAAADLFQC